MRFTTNTIIPIAIILSSLACTTKSNDIFQAPAPKAKPEPVVKTVPPPKPEPVKPTPPPVIADISGSMKYIKKKAIELNNKVDILFVIDNSSSMRRHIPKLQSNIKSFIQAFKANKGLKIDYRIGVTAVWDREKFEVQLQERAKDPSAVKPFLRGQLRPLKNSKGELVRNSDGSLVAPYITPKTDLRILQSTLDIGYESHLCFKDTPKTISWDKSHLNFDSLTQNALKNYLYTHCGPENEEVFSPMLSVVSDENLRTGVNQGFPRNDLQQLIVIAISDAEDDVRNRAAIGTDGKPTNIKWDEIKKEMNSFLKRTKAPKSTTTPLAKVFGATNHQCLLDKNNRPLKDPGTILKNRDNLELTAKERLRETQTYPAAYKISELIKETGGTEADICTSNYGVALAKFGNDIKTGVIEQHQQDLIISLDKPMKEGSLKVYYAKNLEDRSEETAIAQDTTKEKGWYVISKTSVGLPVKAFKYDKDKEIFWTFTPTK